jgi:hypothetical protein
MPCPCAGSLGVTLISTGLAQRIDLGIQQAIQGLFNTIAHNFRYMRAQFLLINSRNRQFPFLRIPAIIHVAAFLIALVVDWR